MAESPWIVDVRYETFEQEVLVRSGERPVVVDFWAPWCGPCRQLGPMLEHLAEEANGDFVLAKVNVDENQQLAMAFGIDSIPAVRVFEHGQPTFSFVGLVSETQLRELLNRIRPSSADRVAREAAGLEKDRPAEAEVLYRKVLADEPHHEPALLGLARLLLDKHQDAEASELLSQLTVGGEGADEAERLGKILEIRRLGSQFGPEPALRQQLEAEPKNGEARYELGCILAAAGRYAEALDMLLSAAERDPKLASTKVREAMVSIFQVVSVRSPLADDYRARLSRLLY
ncbi:MAG TPA: thioredoxin [Gemmataceae bacterium]|nr:thioredoxin [Gemmataceae bacterium]